MPQQCAFLFLTPITSSLCEKHDTYILFNPSEISHFLFFFLCSVSPQCLCHPHPRFFLFYFFYLGWHHLVSTDNTVTQAEYVAGICKVMSSSSVVATKGYYLRHAAIIFPYSAPLMYIQPE